MAIIGRSMRIRRGTTPIAGATTDSLTINNEPVDITDKGDAGWRTLLADAGVRSIDASVNGILEDATLIAVAVGTASALLSNHTVLITGLGTFAGDFYLQGLEIGAEMAEGVTFSATLVSSGPITWTPA